MLSGSKFQPSTLNVKTLFFLTWPTVTATLFTMPLHDLELVYRCRHGELIITVPLPLPFLILQGRDFPRSYRAISHTPTHPDPILTPF